MLMLVTMRGEWGEFNPWQVPMGSIDAADAEADATSHVCQGRARRRRSAPAVQNALQLAFDGDRAAAVLLSQTPDRRQGVGEMTSVSPPPRRDGDAARRPADDLLRGHRARLAAPAMPSPPATTTAISISGAPWAARR